MGTFVARKFAAVALIGALTSLAPAVAAGAVPRASWYWSLAVPRSNPNVLLLATSKGLYRSSAGGKTWRATGPSGLNATSLVQTGNTLIVAGVRESSDASPTIVSHGAYHVAPGPGVVADSTDAGLTWHELHPSGLPGIGIQALAVDPANDRVVYAVIRNGAVYRSTDSAHSFAQVSARIGGTAWALAVVDSGRFVAGDMTTGAYLGASPTRWQHTAFNDARGGRMVMEYAAQPGDLKHVLMTSYGIESSNDSGHSWHVVLKSKVMFGPVAWSAGKPDSAYAVGWDRSLWHSRDGGASWTRVS
jgi:photosystem II stability/assembly factor-like uncharacterized protein